MRDSNLKNKTDKLLIAAFTLTLLIGFTLRIFSAIAAGPGPHWEFFAGVDEAHYHDLADNIITGKIFGAWMEGFFLRSLRAPFYPLMLASAKILSGGSAWAPQLLNITLEAGSIGLLFLLGRSFGRSWQAGCVVSAAYALFGPATDYTKMATTEILAVFLILSCAASLSLLRKYPSIASILLAFFYACLIHTRPAFLPALPFLGLAVFLALHKIDLRKRLTQTAWPLLLVGLLCLPWFLRNWQLQGAAVPVSSIAGWHLAASANSASELSTERLVAYVYKPEHQNFNEGDFFREGRRNFFENMSKHPIRIIGTGILRLGIEWIPKDTWKRFFLPRAYAEPVAIPCGWRIPMPDFEGYSYLAFFVLILLLMLKPFGELRGKGKDWLGEAGPLLVFLSGYCLAHIIAIPLIQYRFIIEPCILLLVISLFLRCLELWPEETSISSTPELKLVSSLLVSLTVLGLLPLTWGGEAPKHLGVSSDTAIQKEGTWDYKTLRQWQWSHNGKIPSGALLRTRGKVRQLLRDYRQTDGGSFAVKDSSWTTGRIIIDEKEQAFGSGDAKLNFPAGPIPGEGNSVELSGEVSLDIYGGLIINVKDWKEITTAAGG